MSKVVYARAGTHEHRYILLTDLAAKMSEEPVMLLFLDSVIALVRVDCIGRGSRLKTLQLGLHQYLQKSSTLFSMFGNSGDCSPENKASKLHGARDDYATAFSDFVQVTLDRSHKSSSPVAEYMPQ
ncbi:hypothetical protein V6N13_046522 [Hibiscus sabdariffa]